MSEFFNPEWVSDQARRKWVKRLESMVTATIRLYFNNGVQIETIGQPDQYIDWPVGVEGPPRRMQNIGMCDGKYIFVEVGHG